MQIVVSQLVVCHYVSFPVGRPQRLRHACALYFCVCYKKLLNPAEKKQHVRARLTGLRTCCFSIKDAEAVLFLCGSFFGCYGLAQLLLNLLGKLRVVFKQVLGAIAALGKLGAVVAEP